MEPVAGFSQHREQRAGGRPTRQTSDGDAADDVDVGVDDVGDRSDGGGIGISIGESREQLLRFFVDGVSLGEHARLDQSARALIASTDAERFVDLAHRVRVRRCVLVADRRRLARRDRVKGRKKNAHGHSGGVVDGAIAAVGRHL